MRLFCLIVAGLIGLSATEVVGLDRVSFRKQVFPPRPESSSPGTLTKVVPFGTLMGGDFTKSFMQITNLSGVADSNFVLGKSLAGRLNLAPHMSDAGNGNKVFFFVNGLSNPPTVSSEGNELHLQFLFPSLQIKGFYKDFSPEGDVAMGDAVAERVQVDVFLTPATDQRGLPTYHSARAVFKGELKTPDKCVYWVGAIFPINMCDLVAAYLKQMKPAIENGIREALQNQQSRVQFDQAALQYLCPELLMNTQLNNASCAQLKIVEGKFRGTDYVVRYSAGP